MEGKGGGKQLLDIFYFTLEKENKLFTEKCSDFIPNGGKRKENFSKFQDEYFPFMFFAIFLNRLTLGLLRQYSPRPVGDLVSRMLV